MIKYYPENKNAINKTAKDIDKESLFDGHFYSICLAAIKGKNLPVIDWVKQTIFQLEKEWEMKMGNEKEFRMEFGFRSKISSEFIAAAFISAFCSNSSQFLYISHEKLIFSKPHLNLFFIEEYSERCCYGIRCVHPFIAQLFLQFTRGLIFNNEMDIQISGKKLRLLSGLLFQLMKQRVCFIKF